jgi:hypothetical protein
MGQKGVKIAPVEKSSGLRSCDKEWFDGREFPENIEFSKSFGYQKPLNLFLLFAPLLVFFTDSTTSIKHMTGVFPLIPHHIDTDSTTSIKHMTGVFPSFPHRKDLHVVRDIVGSFSFLCHFFGNRTRILKSPKFAVTFWCPSGCSTIGVKKG